MKVSLLRSGGSSKAVLMVRLGLLALQGRNPWRTFNAAFFFWQFRIVALPVIDDRARGEYGTGGQQVRYRQRGGEVSTPPANRLTGIAAPKGMLLKACLARAKYAHQRECSLGKP
jgi:hypothetical protein